MFRKIDPCLQCGRDTRAEAEDVLGNDRFQFMRHCGRYFCIRCTENIYEYGIITECPVCGRLLDTRRVNAPNLDEEQEKTPD